MLAAMAGGTQTTQTAEMPVAVAMTAIRGKSAMTYVTGGGCDGRKERKELRCRCWRRRQRERKQPRCRWRRWRLYCRSTERQTETFIVYPRFISTRAHVRHSRRSWARRWMFGALVVQPAMRSALGAWRSERGAHGVLPRTARRRRDPDWIFGKAKQKCDILRNNVQVPVARRQQPLGAMRQR